jgi:hypothetical protein
MMAVSGPDFAMGEFLGAIADTVRPGTARPVVVHADELAPLPADQVHNPSKARRRGHAADHDVRDLPPGLATLDEARARFKEETS